MEYALSELFTLQMGKTPSRDNSSYWKKSENNWISIADLTNSGKYISNTKETLSDSAVAESGIKKIPANTVIMSFKLSLGKVAITEKEMYSNEAIMAFIDKGVEKISPEYLYYLLRAKDWSKGTNKAVMGATLNKATLSTIKIQLHEYDNQLEIVNMLNRVSSSIDFRKQQLTKLDELIKARFVEMFGDINVNNKKWMTYPLGELCTIVRGGSPRPIERYLGGTIPWIKIGDATTGENIYLNSTKEYIIQEGVKKSRMIKAGSLIFANCGVSLGFARIITFDGCIHDGWLAMEDIDEKLDKIFLLYSLNQMTEYFRKTAPAGTQPNLNTNIMKMHRQIVPPMEMQKAFISFVKCADRQKQIVQQSLEKLELMKKALMQEYFG